MYSTIKIRERHHEAGPSFLATEDAISWKERRKWNGCKTGPGSSQIDLFFCKLFMRDSLCRMAPGVCQFDLDPACEKGIIALKVE